METLKGFIDKDKNLARLLIVFVVVFAICAVLKGSLFLSVSNFQSMTVGDREIFGPVTLIKRVKDFDEGIAVMNANPFANGSVVFTQSGYFARKFAFLTDGGMEGRIEVSSQPGAGTEFRVTLPLETAEGAAADRAAPASPEAHSLRGCQVLLCEDNELNMEIAQTLLEQKGMGVHCAANGQEGLQQFQQSPPGSIDIVLMKKRAVADITVEGAIGLV